MRPGPNVRDGLVIAMQRNRRAVFYLVSVVVAVAALTAVDVFRDRCVDEAAVTWIDVMAGLMFVSLALPGLTATMRMMSAPSASRPATAVAPVDPPAPRPPALDGGTGAASAPSAPGDRSAAPRVPQITPAMHSAGMSVVHRSPFSDLEIPAPTEPMSGAFIARWVTPFYMVLPHRLLPLEPALRGILPDVTTERVTHLLAEVNWRPRVVGAFLVALEERHELEDLVGRLLLRSDVCDAGKFYCLALARLNTPRAVEFLREYLRYYLTRPELYFDQGDAMAALLYLDDLNGTRHAVDLMPAWDELVAQRHGHAPGPPVERFRERMHELATLRERLSQPGEVGPAPELIDLL